MRRFVFLFIVILLAACSPAENEDISGDMSELRAQLTNALDSGEITPEMHAQISRKLSDLEAEGQPVAELRSMLSQLKIGGQELTKPQQKTPEIAALHAELTYALLSGGIAPERYAEISKKLLYLEAEGQNVSELRSMFSRLKVGGQELTKPQQKTPEMAALHSQLTYALGTGEITSELHAEISQKLTILETGGQNVTELRAMLSQLKIGGQSSNTSQNLQPVQSGIIMWHYSDGAWRPKTGSPPSCPEQLEFPAPVDLKLATSILYPGQVRTNDFKPHGGFRTDKTTKPVQVTSPTEGYVWRAAKFTDEFGIHYIFDIQHPCGIMHRLGHLAAVPEKFEAIFKNRPESGFGDSRTFELETPLPVALGEVIATNVQKGSGFDWGVYDLRKENQASQDLAFRQAHADEKEQAYHALCWLNYLPDEQENIVKGLPAADGKSGKNSEYC